jgi:hypothetical protein
MSWINYFVTSALKVTMSPLHDKASQGGDIELQCLSPPDSTMESAPLGPTRLGTSNASESRQTTDRGVEGKDGGLTKIEHAVNTLTQDLERHNAKSKSAASTTDAKSSSGKRPIPNEVGDWLSSSKTSKPYTTPLLTAIRHREPVPNMARYGKPQGMS